MLMICLPQFRLRYRPDLGLPGDARLPQPLRLQQQLGREVLHGGPLGPHRCPAVHRHAHRRAGGGAHRGPLRAAAVHLVLVPHHVHRVHHPDRVVDGLGADHDGAVRVRAGRGRAVAARAHVPGGDGAAVDPRRAGVRLPALHHHGHLPGGLLQLRHRHPPPQQLGVLAHRHRPGLAVDHHPGRGHPVLPRDAALRLPPRPRRARAPHPDPRVRRRRAPLGRAHPGRGDREQAARREQGQGVARARLHQHVQGAAHGVPHRPGHDAADVPGELLPANDALLLFTSRNDLER